MAPSLAITPPSNAAPTLPLYSSTQSMDTIANLPTRLFTRVCHLSRKPNLHGYPVSRLAYVPWLRNRCTRRPTCPRITYARGTRHHSIPSFRRYSLQDVRVSALLSAYVAWNGETSRSTVIDSPTLPPDWFPSGRYFNRCRCFRYVLKTIA